MSRILVVDDEVGIRELLSEILTDEGHEVRIAQNAAEARAVRARLRPDLVLLDIWMPDTDGITLLKEWAGAGQLTMPVVVMSGHATIETAVEAVRVGAQGFLEKPVTTQKLLATVGRALAQGMPATDANANADLALAVPGRAPIVRDLRARLERARDLALPVLLLATPGSGEELCARTLHRAHAPWVALDERDFGDDADAAWVVRAAEGTLYLRGIGQWAPARQGALLQRLPAVERAGTRIVSTATPDLPARVADGRFDALLYERLGAITLRVPPLSAHPEDLPEIAGLVLDRLVEAREVAPRVLGTAALNALRLHAWPGNLAQLQAVVRTAALTGDGPEITPRDVAAALDAHDAGAPTFGQVSLDLELREARDAFERAYFEWHLAREGHNMSRVADKVGLERTHLYRKLKQLGIALPRRQDTGE
jgi:DNA-binding NtrC family response regulator